MNDLEQALSYIVKISNTLWSMDPAIDITDDQNLKEVRRLNSLNITAQAELMKLEKLIKVKL